MPGGRITVDGVKQLRSAMRKAQDADIAELKAANAEGAAIVATQARFNVPVDTGALQASVRSSGTNAAGVVRAGFASVRYAGVIHFGWPEHGIEPDPYLFDAADQRMAQVVDQYVDQVNKILDRIAASTTIT